MKQKILINGEHWCELLLRSCYIEWMLDLKKDCCNKNMKFELLKYTTEVRKRLCKIQKEHNLSIAP